MKLRPQKRRELSKLLGIPFIPQDVAESDVISQEDIIAFKQKMQKQIRGLDPQGQTTLSSFCDLFMLGMTYAALLKKGIPIKNIIIEPFTPDVREMYVRSMGREVKEDETCGYHPDEKAIFMPPVYMKDKVDNVRSSSRYKLWENTVVGNLTAAQYIFYTGFEEGMHSIQHIQEPERWNNEVAAIQAGKNPYDSWMELEVVAHQPQMIRDFPFNRRKFAGK